MTTQQQIDQAAELLKDAAPGATVILFGSQATGHARPDSDVDFLIIEPALTSRRKEMARLMRVLRPLRMAADILVLSRQAYEEWANIPGTIIHTAATEGKVLHAAG